MSEAPNPCQAPRAEDRRPQPPVDEWGPAWLESLAAVYGLALLVCVISFFGAVQVREGYADLVEAGYDAERIGAFVGLVQALAWPGMALLGWGLSFVSSGRLRRVRRYEAAAWVLLSGLLTLGVGAFGYLISTNDRRGIW